jgi:hypothetical protein
MLSISRLPGAPAQLRRNSEPPTSRSRKFHRLAEAPKSLSAMTAQRVATGRLPAENVPAALSSGQIKPLNYLDFIFSPEERNTALILRNTT